MSENSVLICFKGKRTNLKKAKVLFSDFRVANRHRRRGAETGTPNYGKRELDGGSQHQNSAGGSRGIQIQHRCQMVTSTPCDVLLTSYPDEPATLWHHQLKC